MRGIQFDSADEKNLEQKELLHNAIINAISTGKYKASLQNTRIHYAILLIAVLVGIIGIFAYVDMSKNNENDNLKTQYEIFNLKGDVVDTWLTWNISEGEIFHVHLENSNLISDEIAQAIFEVIMSDETLEIDDSFLHKGPIGQSSTYYFGWHGALNSISSETFFPIPKTLHYHITDKGEGDILIKLTTRSSPDGYDGYTTSIIDQSNNQILKSTITIYEADKRSIEELKTIVRHELGHGFGLAHSSAPEDLMHPEIITEFPYISTCNITALEELYNGSQKSSVVCEK